MPTLATPGVYIQEVTSPGVIPGVSTSTAAFIGPALNGPINLPTAITAYDDFLNMFGLQQPDGSYNPFIVNPRWFYLAPAVKSFYDNGGQQAYIVRVGTAAAAEWDVKNAAGEVAFRVQAQAQGASGNNITVQLQGANATGAAGAALANPSSPISTVSGIVVGVSDASGFRVGDVVTRNVTPEVFTNRAAITQIQGNTITLANTLTGLTVGDTLRIASVVPTQNTFRLAPSATGVYAGSVVTLKGDDANATGTTVQEDVLVSSIDNGNFVTLASAPARAKTYNLATAVAVPVAISQEFALIITPSGGSAENFPNLSLNPLHPGYIFTAVNSVNVDIAPPLVPPVAQIPQGLVSAPVPPAPPTTVASTVTGVDDNPANVGLSQYQAALDVLKNIQDVNLVLIPDAAASPDCIAIQQAVIQHCFSMGDRFGILDSQPAAPPTGPGSVSVQRESLQAPSGFAALYYPWITIKDPTSKGPIARNLNIPPSGAIAGVYAYTDNAVGVHKPPANVQVEGVTGLERVLSDAQQGPLNLAGIDCLRIFPGTAVVTVWGARTTGDPEITDWIYVNVRRLMIYIEQSIEEGIRWAVFQPNGLPLWQQLKRTLNEFLTRVWRSGALFGATADQAFYVRIDTGLNPPSTVALGQLYIEIGVAPVRPAEFIIVRIGLWDGGAQITES